MTCQPTLAHFNPLRRYTAAAQWGTSYPMSRLQHPAPPNAFNRIRDVRLSKGLTLEQLAEKTGLQWQSLQRYETGARNVSTAKLYVIAKALGVAPSELVSESDDGLSDEERDLIEYLRTHPRDKAVLLSTYRGLRDNARPSQYDGED